MDVPDSLACALCDAPATGLKDSQTEAPTGPSLEPGANAVGWITVDCPNCGWQQQALPAATELNSELS